MFDKNLKNYFFFLFMVATCVSFYFLLLRWELVCQVLARVGVIFRPVIAGLVIAYLLNPLMMLIRRGLKWLLRKKLGIQNHELTRRLAKALSILLAFAIAALAISAFFWIVLPEIIQTFVALARILPGQISNVQEWLRELFASNQTWADQITVWTTTVIEYVQSYLTDFLNNGLLAKANNVVSYLTSGIIGMLTLVYNILVGFVVAVYALSNREAFIGQSKKIVYAFCSTKRADAIVGVARKVNEIFSGFIVGKVMDSIIVGIVTYIILSFLQMPYALLNSVIIGITNVIPIFGPFIGAIPCVSLVLLVSPFQALQLIIFILILQQVDGNIIGPYILGDSTGLPGFWVLLSLIVSGGLWGVGGMILGVPLFATIYYLAKNEIEKHLIEKNFPTDTRSYVGVKCYDEEKGDFEKLENVSRIVVASDDLRHAVEEEVEKISHIIERERTGKIEDDGQEKKKEQ